MFTYLINSETNRIASKDIGYCYIKNPLFDTNHITSDDLYVIEGKIIIFSEQDIAKDMLPYWKYNGTEFVELSPEELNSVLEQEALQSQRASKIIQLKSEIVTLPIEQLSVQHKKLIAGIPFNEYDWAVLGL